MAGLEAREDGLELGFRGLSRPRPQHRWRGLRRLRARTTVKTLAGSASGCGVWRVLVARSEAAAEADCGSVQ